MEEDVQDYIKKMRDAGKSDDEIKIELVKAGWDENDRISKFLYPNDKKLNKIKLSRFAKYSIYLLLLYIVLFGVAIIILSVSDGNMWDGMSNTAGAAFWFVLAGWAPTTFLLIIFSISSLIDIRINKKKGIKKRGKIFSWIIVGLAAVAFLWWFYVVIFSAAYNSAAPNNFLSGLDRLEEKMGVTYEESLDKWGKLRYKNDNSYVFSYYLKDRDEDNILLFKGYEMKVEVRNGVVTDTIYYIWDSVDLNEYREYVSRDQIPLSIDVPIPKTMDQLYFECDGYLTDYNYEDYGKTFHASEEEIMMTCLLTEKECTGEGCNIGFYISGFEWLDD